MLSNLASDRARIAYLESHITALENSLVVLKNERQSVQARLDAYVYPICTLPNEVVSQIFVLTLPPYPSPSPLWGPSSPTLLGQIFQKWREIAFSTPRLWRAPSFVTSRLWTPRQFHLAQERGIELFETWLARSGSCPLSIQLKDARSSVIPVDLSRFSEIIIRHLARIEHLELSAGDEMDLSKQASISETMPLLRTLKLGSWSIQDSIPVARFLDAPRLRSVHIIRSSCPSEVLLPWNQLTSLVLEGISARNSATILNQTVTLIHFRLRLKFPLDQHDIVKPLTRIESLEIDCRSLPFLSALTLPELRSLKITQCYEVAELWHLDNLLSQWGCNLEKLHVIAKRYLEEGSISLALDKCRANFPSIPTLLVEEF
ncbi:hypothetical protein B0H12DRAFT_1269019 [Mycena haematopus]|nr:hypothetical protein B0H12DRAFT_1269019 [Mycena haematopus]